jgi:hypothetical protein
VTPEPTNDAACHTVTDKKAFLGVGSKETIEIRKNREFF